MLHYIKLLVFNGRKEGICYKQRWEFPKVYKCAQQIKGCLFLNQMTPVWFNNLIWNKLSLSARGMVSYLDDSILIFD